MSVQVVRVQELPMTANAATVLPAQRMSAIKMQAASTLPMTANARQTEMNAQRMSAIHRRDASIQTSRPARTALTQVSVWIKRHVKKEVVLPIAHPHPAPKTYARIRAIQTTTNAARHRIPARQIAATLAYPTINAPHSLEDMRII